jgi:hypothetical protein
VLPLLRLLLRRRLLPTVRHRALPERGSRKCDFKKNEAG